MSVYGSIISEDVVEEAVQATLKTWMNDVLAEVERQRGLQPPYYTRDIEYGIQPALDKWPEQQLPLIVIISPGIPERPVKSGRRVYRAKYDVGIAVIVGSTERQFVCRYAQHMGAAIRKIMEMKQSLDGGVGERVRGVDWVGSRNNELPVQDERTIWANRQLFEVEVDDVLTKGGGPTQPAVDPLPPPAEDPIAVEVTVTKEPIA